MAEVLFVIKSILITLILVIFFQVKIGPQTLEEKSFHWIKSSSHTAPLRETAQGAFKIFNDFIGQPFSQATKDISIELDKKAKPATEKFKSRLNLEWRRSKEYVKNRIDQEADEALKQKQEEALRKISP